MFLHADSEDSDQTGWIPRLIWVFAGYTDHFVGFVMRRLIYYSIMTKPFMWVAINKDARQLAHYGSQRLWSAFFVIRFLDGMTPLVAIPEIPRLWLDRRDLVLPGQIWATSWQNLFKPYAINKDADQPAHPLSLISVFILLAKSKLPRL